jgi:hypothetical protein
MVMVAVSGCAWPRVKVTAWGDTTSERATAAAAVTAAVPAICVLGSWAVIVTAPRVVAVARPLDPAAFEMLTAPPLEDHVTAVVRSWFVPSLYVPVASKASVVPSGMFAVAGVTLMDRRTAAVAVTVVCPPIPVAGSVADTTALPEVTAVTWPLEPGAFDTRTAPLVELQVADCVTSPVEPSE